MPDRKPLIAANWKMNKTVGEALAFVTDLLPRVAGRGGVEVVICPPFTALREVAGAAVLEGLGVAAQNMHEADSGAFTGEVSATMLNDAGATGVILGHSERRQYFNETDESLAAKLPVALEAGLEPILCVGETEAQRDAEETNAVLARQIAADLADVPAERLAELVVAYEPIWAIGTGRTATTEQAQDAVAEIRARIAAIDERASERVRILYGGSVKPANAAELLACPDIDGALVGGASLEAEDFAAIVLAASP